jgi:hypothetical protein
MWQGDIVSVVRFVVECGDILQTAVAASHQPQVAGFDVILSPHVRGQVQHPHAGEQCQYTI